MRDPVSGPRRGFGPVVVGVSGSPASFAAVRAAVAVYGVDRPYVLVRAGRVSDDTTVVDADLTAAADQVPGSARRQVVLGDPVPGLCETAERLGAVAIVIGARADAPTWAHPVVRGVTRAASVPVLVVPAPAAGHGGGYGAAPWPPPTAHAPPPTGNGSTSSTATTG